MSAISRCPGCNKVFTHHGLSLHIAKTNNVLCHNVYSASQPQSLFQSPPDKQALPLLTQNSVLSGHPDQLFSSKHPLGDNGTLSDLSEFLLLGNGSITTGDMGDCKPTLHHPVPCTKPTTAAMNDASNSADKEPNNNTPNTTDTTDADTFEIMTLAQTSRILDLDLTMSNPEQIPSAESELPPKNLHDPVEPSGPDMRTQVVIKHFPCGNPGVLINRMQGSSIYKWSQEAFSESVWAPFQSECDWDVAYWAKMDGPSSLALTWLLAIPNVYPPPFFFLYCLAKCTVV